MSFLFGQPPPPPFGQPPPPFKQPPPPSGQPPPPKRQNTGSLPPPPPGQPSPETLFKKALSEHINGILPDSPFQKFVDGLDLTTIGEESEQNNFFEHIREKSLDGDTPIKTLIVDLDNVSYFVKPGAFSNDADKKFIRGLNDGPPLDHQYVTQRPTLKEVLDPVSVAYNTIIDSYRIPAFLILNYAVTNEYKNIIIVAKDTKQKNDFVDVLTKIIGYGICANTGNVDEKSEVVSPNNVREYPFVFKQTIDCSTIQAAFRTREYKCIIVQCNFTGILQDNSTYTRLEKDYVHDLKSGDDLVILQILFGLLDNGFAADNIKIMTNDRNSIRDYLASINRVNQIRYQRFKDLFKAFILPFTITCKTYTYDIREPDAHNFFINFGKSYISDRFMSQETFNNTYQIPTTDELFRDYYFMPSSNASGQRNWVLETNRIFHNRKKITYVKRNTTDQPTIEIPYVKTNDRGTIISFLLNRDDIPFFQPDGITPLYLDNINDGDGNPLLIPYVTNNRGNWRPSLKPDGTLYTNTDDHIATITVPMDPYYTKYLKYKQKYQELKNKLNKN